MSIKVMSLIWENFTVGGSEKLTMLAMADWCNDDGGSLYPSISSPSNSLRHIEQKLATSGFNSG